MRFVSLRDISTPSIPWLSLLMARQLHPDPDSFPFSEAPIILYDCGMSNQVWKESKRCLSDAANHIAMLCRK